MRLLPWAALRSDSEQYLYRVACMPKFAHKNAYVSKFANICVVIHARI
jgi:hypothetical protein